MGKNGTIWERNPPSACRKQDIHQTQQGITNQAHCEEIKSVLFTPKIVDLVALETNREAIQKIREWDEKIILTIKKQSRNQVTVQRSMQ